MGTEFEGTQDMRLVAMYGGVVVDDADPRGLGRVRVRIPGLVEPASAWAFPITVGGGSKGRGWFDVPPKDADVVVWFEQGDPERPRYLGGHWGLPGGESEVPRVAKDAGDDAARVQVYESGRFLLVLDDRGEAYLEDKDTGDVVRLTGSGVRVESPDGTAEVKAGGDVTVEAGGGATVEATGTAEVTAGGQAKVNGAVVALNGPGQPVARLGDAIQAIIPPGLVMVPHPTTGAPVPNPYPIIVPGTIIAGSPTVQSG